jgi:hypothetical protein
MEILADYLSVLATRDHILFLKERNRESVHRFERSDSRAEWEDHLLSF